MSKSNEGNYWFHILKLLFFYGAFLVYSDIHNFRKYIYFISFLNLNKKLISIHICETIFLVIDFKEHDESDQVTKKTLGVNQIETVYYPKETETKRHNIDWEINVIRDSNDTIQKSLPGPYA